MAVTYELNPEIVCIDYTNWRGERFIRYIRPHNIWFGETEWHPEKQWFVRADDVASGKVKDFAMCDIHEWGVI